VSTLLVLAVLGMYEWGYATGLSLDLRRAEAFNMLVFGEIGYALTTRFIKASTFHPRVFRGNPWCFVSMFVTGALQVMLTYVPGLNAFFSMKDGMTGIQWARVLVCMVVIYAIVEIEKALVDPLLMPLVRPVLDFISRYTPKFLRIPKAAASKLLPRRGSKGRQDGGGQVRRASAVPAFAVVNAGQIYGAPR
jgi:magnesium-transporting ATPase (P-type)